MRGEGRGPAGREDDEGIIPAGAGRRRVQYHQTPGPRDHPRGCGEKLASIFLRFGSVGSSPRVRGEGRGEVCMEAPGGIIPAGAGRRERRSRSRCATRDHPRGCGEKMISSLRVVRPSGSSPRVRGEGLLCAFGEALRGIIPAGAGRRPLLTSDSRLPFNHPRGCGEKTKAARNAHATWGSSPRVRGEGQPPPIRRQRPGIIPAGAGRSGL